MDEDQLRIYGAEEAVMALAAWRDPRAVVREKLLASSDDDERTALKHAIQLIEDGRGHHHPFTAGLRLRP